MQHNGFGYDVHRLVEGRRLVLGGVTIPFTKGLLGYSDADVLIHAIADALLGAAAMGDIGKHFPDTDPKYKDISSIEILTHVCNLLTNHGFTIINVDSTLVLQEPKIASFTELMRSNIATALRISSDFVSVKATTSEGLGFVGTGEGAAAYAVVSIQSPKR